MNIPDINTDIKVWLAWVDEHYPFDPDAERRLARRLPRDMPQCGTFAELEDLRGVADPVNLSNMAEPRTRFIAAVLARMWFTMRDRERKQRWHEARMNPQQTERDLSDIDASIGAQRYEQRRLGAM